MSQLKQIFQSLKESDNPKIELVRLFVIANTIVLILLVCLKFSQRVNITKPLYFIKTVDGNFYSNEFRHYGNHVTFLQRGEMIQKSQKGLTGTVVERIR